MGGEGEAGGHLPVPVPSLGGTDGDLRAKAQGSHGDLALEPSRCHQCQYFGAVPYKAATWVATRAQRTSQGVWGWWKSSPSLVQPQTES